VEPWYLVTPHINFQVVSRFNNSAVDNMMQCRNITGDQCPCDLNGSNDPPISLIQSHLDAFMSAAPTSNNTLFFFIGDTQAHDLTGNWNDSVVIDILMGDVMTMLSSYFPAENMFYAAGNNDGPHDTIFVSGGTDADSIVWANQVVNAGIVNNDLGLIYEGNLTQIDFFR
jgi:hypothetical protein